METHHRVIDEARGSHASLYEDERRRLMRIRCRTCALLAMAIVPPYVAIDYLLYPDWFPTLLALRSFSVLLSTATLPIVDGVLGQQFPYALCHILCLGLVLANSAVPVLALGYATPSYVGFIVAIIGVALLLPLRLSQAITLTLSLLTLYLAAALLHGHITNWVVLACNTWFITTTVGIALVGMGAGEQLRRREFDGRMALQAANDTKSRLVAALVEKSAKLEALNEEMKDILYLASHDLRAPLINVQGFSREVQLSVGALRNGNGRSPECNAALTEIDESLQFILTGVARMDTLIAGLLNVSRVVTRTNPTEHVDLQRLTRKVADSLHHQLTEKGIELEFEPLPAVTGDAVQLSRLFSNLLDNAIKYMGNGAERRIRIGARIADGECRFFVQDSGPGIAKEHHEHVFRLCRRLPNGNSTGEGIGLTVVRKIVEKHGGRIWLDSAPGAGSTFWFTLQDASPPLENGGQL